MAQKLLSYLYKIKRMTMLQKNLFFAFVANNHRVFFSQSESYFKLPKSRFTYYQTLKTLCILLQSSNWTAGSYQPLFLDLPKQVATSTRGNEKAWLEVVFSLNLKRSWKWSTRLVFWKKQLHLRLTSKILDVKNISDSVERLATNLTCNKNKMVLIGLKSYSNGLTSKHSNRYNLVPWKIISTKTIDFVKLSKRRNHSDDDPKKTSKKNCFGCW